MRLYVLLNCNQEGYNFLGAYSSLHKAMQAQEEYNNKLKRQYPVGDTLYEWKSANYICSDIELDSEPEQITL